MKILDKIKKTIREYRLLDKGDKLVVGVSGGADSVALLLLLDALKKELALKLHVAHVDHMLRPDSKKDSEFVRNLCERLNIPLSIVRVNVEKSHIKGSLEELARIARLKAILKIAKKYKAGKVALAHNLDDQAETVLMRILRGTGLLGLSAILPARKLYGCTIIRPLIGIRRKEIESFLKHKGIKPRIDSTNLKDIFFRNKLRNKLIPELEIEYNKNIKEVLANLAGVSSCDYDYLIKESKKLFKKFNKKLNLKKFLRLHPAMQRLILRLNILNLKGDTRRIGFQHIKELEDLILHRKPNSIVDLPKGISVIKKKNILEFYLR